MIKNRLLWYVWSEHWECDRCHGCSVHNGWCTGRPWDPSAHGWCTGRPMGSQCTWVVHWPPMDEGDDPLSLGALSLSEISKLEISIYWCNLIYSISFLSWFLTNSIVTYINIIKSVLRYVHRTFNYSIKYFKIDNRELFFYTDSDFADSTLQDNIKSISNYIEYLAEESII